MLRTKLTKIIDKLKGKNGRSRFLLHAAREAGYPPAELRKGLLAVHDVRLSTLARNQPFGKDLLYAVRDGKRNNPVAKELLARAVGLSVDEMFPEEWIDRRRTAAG